MRTLTHRSHAWFWGLCLVVATIVLGIILTLPAVASGAEVDIDNFAFTPTELTVQAGTTVGPGSRHNATGLLNEKFLTSTGQTVAHPGASQGAGATELDRRIEQQNDRIEESICGNCK